MLLPDESGRTTFSFTDEVAITRKYFALFASQCGFCYNIFVYVNHIVKSRRRFVVKTFKWKVMLTTLFAALIVLSGGYVLYEKYVRETPLKESLEAIAEVEKAEVIRSGKMIHVDIFLSYTGNLPELVQDMEDIMENHTAGEYTFTVHDKPNAGLSAYKREIMPALFEGARNGNYRSVKESVLAEAKLRDLEESYFSVDHRRIYLQAKDGEHFLYILVSHYPNIQDIE